MPIRFQTLTNDNYYHVFNRGVNRQPIFNNKRDYARATNLLKFNNYLNYPIRFSKFLLQSVEQRKFIWQKLEGTATHTDILSYCLMPNHFHLLLKQNSNNGISEFLRNFQISYTKYFNTKNNRVGPLLQGQFKAVLIETDKQLLQVSRYIHLNPYSSSILKSMDELLKYKYSSMPEYLGIEQYGICKKDFLISFFKNEDDHRAFIFDNAEYLKQLHTIKHLTFEQVI